MVGVGAVAIADIERADGVGGASYSVLGSLAGGGSGLDGQCVAAAGTAIGHVDMNNDGHGLRTQVDIVTSSASDE